jgi:hypothetical protein
MQGGRNATDGSRITQEDTIREHGIYNQQLLQKIDRCGKIAQKFTRSENSTTVKHIAEDEKNEWFLAKYVYILCNPHIYRPHLFCDRPQYLCLMRSGESGGQSNAFGGGLCVRLPADATLRLQLCVRGAQLLQFAVQLRLLLLLPLLFLAVLFIL